MNTGTGVAGYVPNPYIVNLINLQNTIENITGLTPIDVLSNAVTNIQQMVNFDLKQINVNAISNFDTSPIQVLADLNLSNASLYSNGTLFTLGGGGASISSAGGNSIYVVSSPSISSVAIGFQVGGRTVFSFDGAGRALYFDPSGTGNRFWISSATLVADKVQFGGPGLGAAPGKFLMSKDLSGTGTWSYVSSLTDGLNTQAFISSSGFYTKSQAGIGGGMDSNYNWYFGSTALTGTGDLASSNNVTVVGGGLRLKQGAGQIGSFLVIQDALGNVGLSTSVGTLSSFVIGDQIASGGTSVTAVGGDNSTRFVNNSAESARITSGGSLGIGTTTPAALLDVNGTSYFRNTMTIDIPSAQQNYVFTSSDANGTGLWSNPTTLFTGNQTWLVSTGTSSIQGYLNDLEKVRISTGSAFFTDRIDSLGLVVASGFSSRSPLRFFVNGGNTEVARFTDAGYFGIGTTNPTYNFQVIGNQSNSGNISLGGNMTAVAFSGNGSNITSIDPGNVGSGSNNLNTFYTNTRDNFVITQNAISTTNSNLTSTIYGLNSVTGAQYYSTLSSQLTTTSNALSSLIGPGAGAQISSFSTAIGSTLFVNFSTISSVLWSNQTQLSTLSTQNTSYASSIASTTSYSNASTIDMYLLSTIRGSLAIGKGQYAIPAPISALEVKGNVLLDSTSKLYISSPTGIAVGMKIGQDLSGSIEASGTIFSRGLRGLAAPFGLGVGPSTTLALNKGGLSPGIGWNVTVVGDLDISGYIYRNGTLYNTGGIPDFYWAKSGSNLYYADGNVGIGTPYPSYPLDVAGKIRCWGVDVIPGAGPLISTNQGPYVSPWLYQSSNIYYNLGGVGVGSGLSSVKSGVFLDISGGVRQRHSGAFFQSTVGVGIPFGLPLQATLDVSGTLHANTITADGNMYAQNFLTPSDRRLKENIEPLEGYDRVIENLQGVQFRWKSSGTKDIGYIAQDVETILPEAVNLSPVNGYTVAYEKLIPVLTESVKSLQKRVNALEEEIQLLRRGT
jgi:hypothetical protein